MIIITHQQALRLLVYHHKKQKGLGNYLSDLPQAKLRGLQHRERASLERKMVMTIIGNIKIKQALRFLIAERWCMLYY